ncbi:hypothetical protein CX658_19380 [Pseudomonas amygdali pv. lachrymans]|nr:hypothetical protein CX658_19380 [Pseudomonas amygdali pv. lachrymans]
MKLSSFVFVYERSLIELNRDASDLNGRIALIQARQKITPGGRLASRLNLYRHQVASLKHKHRAAACWVVTVAQPIFSIMAKRLGAAYQGTLLKHGTEHASLKFIHDQDGVDRSLTLKMTLARLCTEPSNESVGIAIHRLINLPSTGCVAEDLSLDITISDLLSPLMAV